MVGHRLRLTTNRRRKMAVNTHTNRSDTEPPVTDEDDVYHHTTTVYQTTQDKSEGPLASKLTALVLIVPGIGLYIYIIYILWSTLVYPGSFTPFVRQVSSSSAPPPPTPSPLSGNTTHDPVLTRSILTDVVLMWLFVIQHTLMAARPLKRFFERINMSAIVRPLYVLMTCFVVNVVNYFWCTTPTYTLWQTDIRLIHVILLVVHMAGWLSIACSLFYIDYLELLGIKQIYYSYYGFSDPMKYKSAEQQTLLSHHRHPIFLAPLVILWAVPTMTYDRFLVAVMLPLYLGWGGMVDETDVEYVRLQFQIKKAQLLVDRSRKSN